MARPRTRIPLNIFLNGRVVGSLRRQASGAIDFEYGSAWLAWEHALPVSLSLPLREDRYVGETTCFRITNRSAGGWLSGSGRKAMTPIVS